MIKGILILMLFASGVVAHSEEISGLLPGEFAAPVIYDRSQLKTVGDGTIVFDSSTVSGPAGLFVLPPSVNPGTATNWQRLTSLGLTPVASGGTERVERASINTVAGAGTINSQSGSWVASVSRTGAGDYTLNFSGIWSASPQCSCTAFDSNSYACSNVSNSSTTVRFRIFNTSTGGLVDGSSGTFGFNVVCEGPQ